jgi:hypothetical protein
MAVIEARARRPVPIVMFRPRPADEPGGLTFLFMVFISTTI